MAFPEKTFCWITGLRRPFSAVRRAVCGIFRKMQDFVTKKVRKNYGGKRGTVPQVMETELAEVVFRTKPEVFFRKLDFPALCRMNIRGDYASF